MDSYTFIKYEEHHQKVLSFIKEKFPYQDYYKMPDSEGILHGYKIQDAASGEEVTVGWDYVFNQVMYLRDCQPLMYADMLGKVEEK